MIKIENLTKIYDKNSTPALDNVSFSLPNKGFVFILGKSGSGKSTLLNLLGGLDQITSGEIIADGNKFSQLNEKDFDNYRNSYVGFIFQDFCLIDMLTVKENIKLSLNLQNTTDDDKINQLLKRVELEKYSDRPIKKLSGGQKQRVAIARALVKNPKLILADEPTGNLDSKTSVQILELLKDLSKENLVVIVSHNTADAYKYADRIIEISDGKIIQDIENSGESNTLTISDDSIILPYNAILSSSELEAINENKLNKEIKQHKPLFKPTIQPKYNKLKKSFKNSKLKKSSMIRLSYSFLTKRIFNFILTTVLISAILVILGLSQMFMLYDGTSTIQSCFQNAEDKSFILKKGYISDDVFKEVKTDKMGRITDDEIEKFYDAGYSGKIYKLTNASMSYLSPLELCKEINYNDNFKNFYAKSNLGLLECDEEFLIKLFGNENGEINVLAGTLDYSEKPYGLILTDYMADSFIYYNKNFAGTTSDPYGKLINAGRINNRFAVLAVIDTNYKVRHKDVIESYQQYFNASTKLEKEKLYKKLTSSQEYIDFYNELTNYLAINYSTNPNYRQATIDYIVESRIVGYFNNLDVYDLNGNLLGENLFLQCDNVSWAETDASERFTEPISLQNNEIYLLYTFYNDLFGTNITPSDTSEFEVKTVVFKNYDMIRNSEDEPLYTKTYTIKGLSLNPGTQSLLTDEEFQFVRQYDVYTNALYFDSPENCSNLYYFTQDTEYYLGIQKYDSVYQVINIVDIFKEYFGIIVTILIVISILLLFSFGFGNVKNRQYEIGILRALGCKTKNLAIIFFIHSLLLGIFTAIISVSGIVLLTDITNTLLIEGFKTYINSSIISLINGIQILSLSPKIILIDLSLVFVMTMFSGLIPLILIHKIKPMKIIRSKD